MDPRFSDAEYSYKHNAVQQRRYNLPLILNGGPNKNSKSICLLFIGGLFLSLLPTFEGCCSCSALALAPALAFAPASAESLAPAPALAASPAFALTPALAFALLLLLLSLAPALAVTPVLAFALAVL